MIDMRRFRTGLLALVTAMPAVMAGGAPAQTFPTGDPVLRAIWEEGTGNSQLERLAQVLLDSIGPRLTASPGQEAAQEWAVRTYGSWGIPARNETYGTWRRWRRGISHIHLAEPRVRTLSGGLLAWSPGTGGGDVTGEAVVLPVLPDRASFEAWLPGVRGRFVLLSYAEPTCRPDPAWQQFAEPATVQRLVQERQAERNAWIAGGQRLGFTEGELVRRFEEAGAVGVVTLTWSGGYGAYRVFNARTERIPTFGLSCEDYGLVARLAEAGQRPVLRAFADAEFLGEVPVFNTIAEIRGRELPHEYVMLSAHFDSWDGASGATDNGTGTITMMKAMRILRAVHPNPRRTILVGHWSGEEQGLTGSRAFAFDNPAVVDGLQALLNQDNGTGPVRTIGMSGFTEAGAHFARWLAAIPSEISDQITLGMPGMPSTGGTDHAAFVCHGAPAFNLSSAGWDYNAYTWHTNLDTYDKISFNDVRHNALLIAMLTYLAAEDDSRVSLTRRVIPGAGGDSGWPECPQPARSWDESPRVR
jgi:carboxypeptidase Q